MFGHSESSLQEMTVFAGTGSQPVDSTTTVMRSSFDSWLGRSPLVIAFDREETGSCALLCSVRAAASFLLHDS